MSTSTGNYHAAQHHAGDPRTGANSSLLDVGPYWDRLVTLTFAALEVFLSGDESLSAIEAAMGAIVD